jgi:hypothetical protein
VIVLVDTHAHLYRCHDVDRFLASARRNLSRLGTRHVPHAQTHVLCLTERSMDTAFADLAAERQAPRGWRLVPCAESGAVRLRASDSFELILVAGRQVVTRERVEVLALGIAAVLPDGLPLCDTLGRIRERQGVPVLPWSPGKWLGQRGRTVRAVVETAAPGDFLLGDTALRPRPGILPRLLVLGRERGIRLLAGSDPLPLPGDERHVARYATLLDTPFSAETPVASLRLALSGPAPRVTVCGSRRSWPSVALALSRHALALR